jgi:hypothetical protein
VRRGTGRDGPAALRPPFEALTGNPARAEHEPVETIAANAGRAAVEQADVQRGADIPRHLDKAAPGDFSETESPGCGAEEHFRASRCADGADPVRGGAWARHPQLSQIPAGHREQPDEGNEVADLGYGIVAEQQEVDR